MYKRVQQPNLKESENRTFLLECAMRDFLPAQAAASSRLYMNTLSYKIVDDIYEKVHGQRGAEIQIQTCKVMPGGVKGYTDT